MENKFWKSLGSNFAVGVLIEYAVFLAISMVLHDSDEYYYAFLMMAAFWVAQLIIWLKNQVVAIIFYRVWGKRKLVEILETDFHRNKMPIFEDDEFPIANDYLNQVVEDNRSQRNHLIFAGSFAGMLRLASEIKPTAGWRLQSAFLAALKQYSSKCKNIAELNWSRSIDANSETTEEDRQRFDTTALDELSEEDERRQGELLERVKAKTRWAASIAWEYHNSEVPPEAAEDEWRRYTRFKEEAYRDLEELTDEFYHNSGLHFMIDMLVVAQEGEEATSLLEKMTIDFIRDLAASSISNGPAATHNKMKGPPA